MHGVLAAVAVGSYVEESLVDGHALHERRFVVQDGHNLGAYLAIAVEVSAGPNGIGAQPLCLPRRMAE